MGSFYSVKVAKGVRISASSRGLRAHVGPRGARLHVGSGRTGMSTGAGPFTYYSSVSGGRSSAASSRSGGATKAQLAQAEKERQFIELRDALKRIVEIHRITFPTAQPPVLFPARGTDEKVFIERREKEQLAGISVLKRSLRKQAKERAAALAAQDVAEEKTRLTEEHERMQAEANNQWTKLIANDPETVIALVDQAFEDNKAPAAPVDVDGSTLSLVMLAPSAGEIPDRMPELTPTGKPTTKKMTKAIHADTYLTLICGHLLATIKEALAVAPEISHVKAVVVREAAPDVYGEVRMDALLAATYSRSDLARVQWAKATSPEIVEQTAEELLWQVKGKAPELIPLDLGREPELKLFVQAIEGKLSESGE